MENKLALGQVVETILKDYPTLQAITTDDGLIIRSRDGGNGTQEGDFLVGTYTSEGLEKGQISLEEIREDCEAFLSSGR